MHVGDWYRISETAHNDWIKENRRICEIDVKNRTVFYRRVNNPDGEDSTFIKVQQAIQRGDWVLLYPVRVCLPLGA